MKHKNSTTIALNKENMKIFKAQIKAIKIHQKIYNARKEVLNDVFAKQAARELEKRFKKILKEESPKIEEIMVLKEILRLDSSFIPKDLGKFYINHEVNKIKAEKVKDAIDFYSSLEEVMNRVMNKQLKTFIPKNKNGVVVYLSSDGDLFIELRGRHCYHIKSKLFFNVLMFLDYNYKKTEDIRFGVGAKNNDSLRKEIGKLKSQIKARLGLSDFIESESGLGYRINSRYTFIKH